MFLERVHELFARSTFRHRELPDDEIQAAYQAVVVAKVTYASSAWWDSQVQLIVVELKCFFVDQ